MQNTASHAHFYLMGVESQFGIFASPAVRLCLPSHSWVWLLEKPDKALSVSRADYWGWARVPSFQFFRIRVVETHVLQWDNYPEGTLSAAAAQLPACGSMQKAASDKEQCSKYLHFFLQWWLQTDFIWRFIASKKIKMISLYQSNIVWYARTKLLSIAPNVETLTISSSNEV